MASAGSTSSTRASSGCARRRSRPFAAEGRRRTRPSRARSSRARRVLAATSSSSTQRRRHLMDSDRFEQAVAAYQPKDFIGALRRPHLAVIAEMKQRTPSMGTLADDYRPADLAHAYADGGAAAISVLTHMAGFGGRVEHVRDVRAATALPILRKDFVTDPYEIAEARACGADAVLLIVAALEPARLKDLFAVARSRGVAAPGEGHDEAQTEAALAAG